MQVCLEMKDLLHLFPRKSYFSARPLNALFALKKKERKKEK